MNHNMNHNILKSDNISNLSKIVWETNQNSTKSKTTKNNNLVTLTLTSSALCLHLAKKRQQKCHRWTPPHQHHQLILAHHCHLHHQTWHLMLLVSRKTIIKTKMKKYLPPTTPRQHKRSLKCLKKDHEPACLGRLKIDRLLNSCFNLSNSFFNLLIL